MKTPFLSWLTATIASTQEPVDQGDPVVEGEKVLGTMSEGLKTLMTVYFGQVDEHNRLIEEHQAAHRGDEPVQENTCDEFYQKLGAQGARVKLLKKLFWQEVNEEFGDGKDLGHLGVRQGFQVVEISRPDIGDSFSSIEVSIVRGGIPPELREILGAGGGAPGGLKGLFEKVFGQR